MKQTYKFVVDFFVLTNSNNWIRISEVFSPEFEIHSGAYFNKSNKKKKKKAIKRKLDEAPERISYVIKKRKYNEKKCSNATSPVSVIPDYKENQSVLPYKYYQIDNKGNVTYFSMISSC